ncbi:MAG: S1C family serine protease [Planctomycetota bacterium]
MMTPLSPRFCFWLAGAILVSCWLPLASISPAAAQTVPASELSPQDWEIVRAAERQRLEAIRLVEGSVVAIYDFGRQGGGSGVVIDPSGIVVTNHHVIMGAGVKGVAGLSDGQLYEWDLIGTDPGGDVAIIQLKGKDRFPSSRLADSETVCVGDWALAMGNPFVLTEDQAPTITLGIVSGVKRFQEGAGQNQLVYGNCIQVDSSINPGNSGGPLFNLSGRVIGINGRGSFLDRGRVNVGLGYAISSNQIKNFLPDLLATKLVEHGTLDANFSDQGGRVICSTINEVSPVAEAGLELGDELLEFEGEAIRSANQYMYLVCNFFSYWQARLKVRNW